MITRVLFVVFFLLTFNLFAQTATKPSGKGVSNDPYLINTLEELNWISQNPTEWGKVYFQTADIDASSTNTWDGGNGFLPIGTVSTTFSGSYDGTGHSITGLFINRPSTNFIGLFGYTNPLAVIRNISLINVNFTGYAYVGGFVGNCAGLIDYCSTTGVVAGASVVGGFSGSVNNGTLLSHCYSAVSVNGSKGNNIGGFVGVLAGNIENCYATGSVTGQSSVGGLIGSISNPFNTPKVTNCYSTGLVSGPGNVGGLIGVGTGNVKSSLWNIETSGQASSSGGTGETTVNMKTQSTYSGWDFSGTWTIDAGINNGYPYILQLPPASVTIAGNAGAANAVLSYTDGTAKTTAPDISGNYSFSVSYNWSGTVTPAKAGYTFSPTNKTYANITTDQTGQDYTATLVPEITAVEPSGSGTADDPFQIATLENLYWLTQNSTEWTKVYKQTADIDASSSSTWDAGKGFKPIGSFSNNFTGSFDGKGYTISGLFINRPSTNFNGFFGCTGYTAVIKNISLTNVNITGYGYIGGLVGINSGLIDYCSSTGTVSGISGVGGLIGAQNSESVTSHSHSSVSVNGNDGNNIGGCVGVFNGSINNCYATGSVNGNAFIGGLIGSVSSALNDPTITNCYSTGSVSGKSAFGGLIGVSSINVSSSFWDTQTSGQAFSSGGTGETTSNMKIQATYSGWDFNNTWTIDPSINNGYPSLRPPTPATITIAGNAGVADAVLSYTDGTAKTATADVSGNYSFAVSYNWAGTVTPAKDGYTFSPTNKTYANVITDQTGHDYTATLVPVITAIAPSGSGTVDDPFQIAILENLYWITQNPSEWGKAYMLTADIDASSSSTLDAGKGFLPIGNATHEFSGSFDGKGYTINGLFINRPSTNFNGLFGYTAYNSKIKNIALINVNITGSNYVGGLVGVNSGSIDYCSSTGLVTGFSAVGGLVGGQNSIGVVSKSYSSASVNGNSGNYIGGFVGLLGGNMINCYATGSVIGGRFVGGLIGTVSAALNVQTIKNCYSTGSVSGTSEYGGLVGVSSGNVNSSFWDIQTSGQTTSSGGTGEPTANMKIQSTYSGWDFTNTWTINPGVNNGYPSFMPPTPATVTIAGNVSVTGATLNYTDGTAKTATADISGNYSFVVSYNWSGTVTPTKDGYTFSPINKTYTNTTTDQTGQDYIATQVPVITAIAPSGSGTADDPFQIATLENLYWLTQNSSEWAKVYKQTTDIDASSTNTWDAGKGFTPIGNQLTGLTKYFAGTYDGNGHVISGIYINRPEAHMIGLFGLTFKAVIKNLGVTGENITGAASVGGLIGISVGMDTINNCFTSGTIISTITSPGSLIRSGGLIGTLGLSAPLASVTNCYSTASVTGYSLVAGLIGHLISGTVKDCYSTGFVSGNQAFGGLVGFITSGQVSNSFWDTQTSGQVISAGGIGMSTVEMKTQVTYTGWDFNNTWTIDPNVNNGYPYLSPPAPATVTISGNTGVAGTELSYTDGTAKTATADSTGHYSFAVSYNWSGSVTPTKEGYTFSPVSGNYSNITFNLSGEDYSATPLTFMISGNAGIPGATLSYTNGTAQTATSDLTGTYSFFVPYNWSGTVTPTKEGFTFSPKDKTYENVTTDQMGQNYSVTTLTFSISGNAGVGGTILSYTDGTAKTATADSTGKYSFAVSYNWSGTVTPTKEGYTFSPANKTYANITAFQAGQDYTASALTFNISGNAGIADAILSYTDSTAKTATADSTGKYSFAVSYNWSGTVTPTKEGYTFSPANKTYTNITADQSGQDYTSAAVMIVISGKAGVAGAKLSYIDVSTKVATADSTGKYSFTVSYQWSGTVTPTKEGYTFSPTNKTYTKVTTDQTSQNYTAALITFTISGNVGIAGVVLFRTNSTGKVVTSDANGDYSFTAPYNWSGTVTPTKEGFKFSPADITYSNIKADQQNQDYSASSVSGIDALQSVIPQNYVMYQNYPNPFNPSTVIRYGLPKEGNVRIIIYDVLGKEVQTLFDGFKKAGYYEVSFDAGKLASGMYIYRIEAESFHETKKMLLTK